MKKRENLECRETKFVPSLGEVSEMCRTSKACKSKAVGDGGFLVTLWDASPDCAGEDPRTVYTRRATQSDKLESLSRLLDESGFDAVVREKCLGKKECKVVVKTNLAPASQKPYHYYTDPVLVDAVVDRVERMGFKNVMIVEAETNFVMAHPTLTPDQMAPKLGFRHPVHNLTRDERVVLTHPEGEIELSKTMVEADVIINVAKGKNHDLTKMTAALKNMYGSIPDNNKYRLFHKKKSGLDIAEATVFVNHATPVDFVIVDMVDSVDGNEVSMFKREIESFPHFQSELLFAGRDPLALDKVISRKMGYGENESPITAEEAEFVGDYRVTDDMVRGGTLEPMEGWRKVGPLFNLKAKVQDKIPVSDETIASQIRKSYKFTIL